MAFALCLFLALSPKALSAEARWAIGGYDPVAYFTDGRATKGEPQYEYTWDDSRYRFASAAHRDLFKAHPAQYAPQFPGFCAMSLASGLEVEPNPENWLVADGKLYLFGKSIGPAKFSGNLDENAARANESWNRLQRGEALANTDRPH
jgi:YHS domain-containing protein